MLQLELEQAKLRVLDRDSRMFGWQGKRTET